MNGQTTYAGKGVITREGNAGGMVRFNVALK